MDSYIGFYTLTLYKNCILDFYRMYIYNEKQVLRGTYILLHAKSFYQLQKLSCISTMNFVLLYLNFFFSQM